MIRHGRTALILVGLLLLAGACFASYRSGCVFDGKQGYGDAARGQLYDAIAAILLVGEIGIFGLAALLSSRGPGQALAAVAAVVVLAGPVSLYIVFEAGIKGIVACKPV